MFKKKINDCPDENRVCAYCEHSVTLGDSGTCICDEKGFIKDDGTCRKFSLDLLKIKPKALKLTDVEENSLLFKD